MYHLETKIKGQGENITLNNTAEAKFKKFEISGNSWQETGNVTDEEGNVIGAMPSPEFRSEIKNVTGSANFYVVPELADISKFTDKGYVNSLGTISSSTGRGEKATEPVKVKPNTNYTFFIINTNSKFDNWIGIGEYEEESSSSFIKRNTSTASFKYNFTTSEKTNYVILSARNLEEATNVSFYETSKIQTFIFPLAEGQRLMKGDYLADDEIHHKRKALILTGTENFVLHKDSIFRLSIADIKPTGDFTLAGPINAISSHFKGITWREMYDRRTIGIAVHNASKAFLISTEKTITTVEQFTAYLAEQYANGTPVTVEYELETEEIKAYTPEQQAVYNEIKKTAHSYGDTTHIFCTDETSLIFDVSAYKRISEEFKQRLLNGKITRAYLKVLATDTKPEMIIDENNYLKDCTFEELRYVPDEGFIGGTVAKRVICNFNNVDSSFSIQDREFELYLGVDLEDGTTEYIKYGTFIVQKPEDDQVNDNTSFEALDYMIKLNLPWVDRMTYPCTLKELFDDLVAQSGLSTKVTSFLNQDFIVENNQFEEGTTRRDVLKAIAQMAFNWARVDEDNDIVMDFEKKDEIAETLTADNYYNFKKQDMYGPINVIILRNSQVEGENITIRDEESIAQYGETELVISDNPFAYTQAKRAELIEAGRILFGLTYIPMSMDMIGYMYLNCKDKIKATNLNNETFETYLLNHTIEYAGTISDSMEAPAATNTETKYQFTPPMIEALKHTELLVDKANQRIDAVIKNISDTNEKMVEIEATLDGVTSTVKSAVQIANEAKETAEQTSEKFENLQSGANNLIINSGYFNNTDGWEANGDGIILNVENFDGFNCIKSTGSIVYSYNELSLYNAGFIRLEPNSTYIIQLEMYLYRELAEGETDITYPINISSPLHTYVNSMKSTGVVMSGDNAIDSKNGASVKKTLLSSSSYKTNEWVKIQLKIETGNPTLDYPYYAIKPFIWRRYCWNNRWKYGLYEKYLCKTNKYYFRLVAFSK